jgi:hypothetical protein
VSIWSTAEEATSSVLQYQVLSVIMVPGTQDSKKADETEGRYEELHSYCDS